MIYKYVQMRKREGFGIICLMKNTNRMLLGAVAFAAVVGAAFAVEPPEGFVSIFNGRDTSGWYGTKAYGVDPAEPGVLQCFPERRKLGDTTDYGNLCTVKKYRNFILRFEFQMPKNGNNGLGVRVNSPLGYAAFDAMCEIQLLDDGGDLYYDAAGKHDLLKDYQYTGSIYGIFPARRDNRENRLWCEDDDYTGGGSYLHKAGQWNQAEARVVGEEIAFFLNGHCITRANLAGLPTNGNTPDGSKHPGLHTERGSISWQGHGDNVKWRNIFVKELPDDATMADVELELEKVGGGGVGGRGEGVEADRVGVCSWSYQKPLTEVAAEMKKAGVKGINLALAPFLAPDGRHGVAEGAEALAFAKRQFASGEWKLMSTMISFPQEDYTTLESIRKTGGIVPDEAWLFNSNLIVKAAALTKELGGKYLLLHAGFLDESDAQALATYRARVSFIRDECAKNGVLVILESGQETADDLAKFLKEMPGVGVNFDPANMILYGKGEPLKALRTLRPWIVQLHVKDANPTAVPGTWGAEVPWGEGKVNAKAFVAELKRLGYKGNFVIEREGGDSRAADIALAAHLLRGEEIR